MNRTGSASSLLFGMLLVLGCKSSDDEGAANGTGGTASGTGGAGAGAVSTGGASTGGAPSASGASGTSGGSGPTGGGPVVTGGATNGEGGQAPSTGGSSAGGSSAGGSGAGGSGAGAPAGGSGGAAQTDPCDGALFCDDFEAYDKGKAPGAPWAERVSSGTVSVDDSQHVSGSKSVKFTTEAKDGTKTAFIRLKGEIFPLAGNLFYGRMMVRLEAAPTASVHWTLLQATGTVPDQTYRSQYRYGGQHPIMDGATFVGSQLMANYETPDSYGGNGPSSDCWVHADKKVLPVGDWVCVEWQFDGPKDAMRFWMNDQALDDLSVDGVGQGCVSQPETYRWTAPTFSELEVGWEAYQNDAARTLYIDDLVVSTTRVGCPK